MDKKYEDLKALLMDKNEREIVFSGSAEQALTKLEERGIKLSREELQALADGFMDGARGTEEDGEMTEAALENVAGGRFGIGFFWGIGQGSLDRSRGTYDEPRGGWLYKQGYALGSGKW